MGIFFLFFFICGYVLLQEIKVKYLLLEFLNNFPMKLFLEQLYYYLILNPCVQFLKLFICFQFLEKYQL